MEEPGSAGEDEDDELMTLKRKAAPLAAAGQKPPEPAADAPDARPKKRRKLRIAGGKVTGTRVVFDEGGEQLAPLERLGADTR